MKGTIGALGSILEASASTDLDDSKVERIRHAGEIVKTRDLARISEVTGKSADWLLGFDVPSERRASEFVVEGITRDQLIRGLLSQLQERSAASFGGALSVQAVSALEAWSAVRADQDVLDRVLTLLAEHVAGQARSIVYDRMLQFANFLSRTRLFREREFASRHLDHHQRFIRETELAALEARHASPDGRLVQRFFQYEPATFDAWTETGDDLACTLFAVPGALAWGLRDKKDDILWYLDDARNVILRLRSLHAKWPLFGFPSAATGRDRFTTTWIDRYRGTSPPGGGEVVHLLKGPIFVPPPISGDRTSRTLGR